MDGLQFVWGWQPALYLFLGGMGAGAFVAAMVVWFREGEKAHRTVVVSVLAAVVCLIAGLLLLLSELISPLRGMMMWQSFSNFTSWMTFGAWIVFAAVVVFLLQALCLGALSGKIIGKVWKGFGDVAPKLGRVLAVIGVVLGVCVAAYTGILLMSAPGVPLWNTPLIPCLFTVSALDTGVALVEIVAFVFHKKDEIGPKTSRILQVSVIALVVLELVVLALLLTAMLGSPVEEGHVAAVSAQSAQILTQGALAPLFWGLVVAVGLALPLVASALSVVGKGKAVHAVGLVGAAGALVGGCALRFLIVMAGIHADPVMDAVATLFG